MEKKPSNAPISKSVLKTLNKNYVSEPLKDEIRINELMSYFIQGEMDKINSILETNDFFNFKDSHTDFYDFFYFHDSQMDL